MNPSVLEQGGCEDVGVYEAQRIVLPRGNGAKLADDGVPVFISCPVENVVNDQEQLESLVSFCDGACPDFNDFLALLAGEKKSRWDTSTYTATLVCEP
jgi:hypothetical protein